MWHYRGRARRQRSRREALPGSYRRILRTSSTLGDSSIGRRGPSARGRSRITGRGRYEVSQLSDGECAAGGSVFRVRIAPGASCRCGASPRPAQAVAGTPPRPDASESSCRRTLPSRLWANSSTTCEPPSESTAGSWRTRCGSPRTASNRSFSTRLEGPRRRGGRERYRDRPGARGDSSRRIGGARRRGAPLTAVSRAGPDSRAAGRLRASSMRSPSLAPDGRSSCTALPGRARARRSAI